MKITIERWILVALLALSYLTRAPGLFRQGMVGFPALVVGFFIAGILIALLLRSSAQAALVIAFLAGLGTILVPLSQLVIAPMLTGVPRPPILQVALPMSTSLIAVFCAIDLWSHWRKKPNQAPEPTPTSVTPPAGQEARQP